GSLSVSVVVPVEVGRDVDACRDRVRPQIALYVGGMGARGRNFYFDLACRYGFEADAVKVQDLFLAGRAADAAAAVPDGLVDAVSLVGDRDRIAERIAVWDACGVDRLVCGTRDPEALRVLADAAS